MVKLPPPVEREVAAVIKAHGAGEVLSLEPVAGGCISPAAKLQAQRAAYFLKWTDGSAAGPSFPAEAVALGSMRATATVTVPAVLASGSEWLLLEWLAPAAPTSEGWHHLGARLARMHQHKGECFGWDEHNCIGSLPQDNTPATDWPTFWRERRLAPQIQQAHRLSARDRAGFDRLFGRLDDLLEVGNSEGASLLHGDLWSGNVHAFTGGIALVDPASYYGHREVDLAMAALFGGFPPEFWSAYGGVWPLVEEQLNGRRAVYQLYYLLVHVNLFGGSYLTQTRAALTTALKA